jgi:hypothetical protein
VILLLLGLHPCVADDILMVSKRTRLGVKQMPKDSSDFQPDYNSLLKFIRNLGIKPEDCLRDIGDNGYDAGSDRIKILFIEKANRSKMAKELHEIQVIDWGSGMRPSSL